MFVYRLERPWRNQTSISFHTTITVLLLFIWATTNICLAQEQPVDLQKEIQLLKQGQEAISKDLQMIKMLLIPKAKTGNENGFNLRGKKFDVANRPVMGSNTAEVMLIEFSDYQCFYCGRYVRETLPKILDKYVSTGKIRYMVVDLPLPMHKLAFKAAEASFCAKEQGMFWEMHDQMMSNQASLDNVVSFATSLHLKLPQFENCIDTNHYVNEIEKEVSLASTLGITGVPGFILAQIDIANVNKFKGISFIAGAQPFEIFEKEIMQALQTIHQ